MKHSNEANGLLVEYDNELAIIRFNRPSSRNSLSQAALTELDSLFTSINECADISSVIFTGHGNVFASGADLREIAELNPASARAFSEKGQSIFNKIAAARPITVAAINGFCMGGALDLALACNIRVASRNASFAHPGTRLGIITGWGGTQRLPRLIGPARANELFLSTRSVDAEEALRMNLISGIGDPVLDYAMAVAQRAAKEVADFSTTSLVDRAPI